MVTVKVAEMDLVVQTSSGHLECRSCGMGTNWCKHIKKMCEDGEDAALVWQTVGNNIGPREDRIEIPYVPGQDQFARVVIGEEHLGNWKLFYIGHEEKQREFLGFVSPGEGRAIMRQMFHNWFWPRIDADKECKSSSHSFQAQLIWQKDVASGGSSLRHLAQRFSVFERELCIVCAGVGSEPADDLIPDVTAPRRWTR